MGYAFKVQNSLTISKKTCNMKVRKSSAIKNALWRDAEHIFESMKSVITKMVIQAKRFDQTHREGVFSEEGLEHEARNAIFNGLDKYRSVKDRAIGLMKAETYAYWYLLKQIYGSVDANRVVYDVYDASGSHIGSYPAREYFQKKRRELPKGHTFQSRRLDVSIEDLKGDKNK